MKRMDADRVVVFDTTLRDGAQAYGAAMDVAQKVEVAELLDQMGADVIEAGFPASSDAQFKAVREVAAVTQRAKVCALARATTADIDTAGSALKPALNKRIHTFIGTSPIHREHKFGKDTAWVLAQVSTSVAHARQYGEVQWSPEDATRTEPEFLAECVEAAIEAGATTINIPDTVGWTLYAEYQALMTRLMRVKGASNVVFSVHCHNDLGMAVANSLAGLEVGARQVECTINGIGERAGNAALEEMVAALKVREDLMGLTTNIDLSRLTEASQLVAALTGYEVQRHKAVVGTNAFRHASGIHQDGMIKNRNTYEIMDPAMVGNVSSLPLDRNSGRRAFAAKLESLGHTVGGNRLDELFVIFKQFADSHRVVSDADVLALAGA